MNFQAAFCPWEGHAFHRSLQNVTVPQHRAGFVKVSPVWSSVQFCTDNLVGVCGAYLSQCFRTDSIRRRETATKNARLGQSPDQITACPWLHEQILQAKGSTPSMSNPKTLRAWFHIISKFRTCQKLEENVIFLAGMDSNSCLPKLWDFGNLWRFDAEKRAPWKETATHNWHIARNGMIMSTLWKNARRKHQKTIPEIKQWDSMTSCVGLSLFLTRWAEKPQHTTEAKAIRTATAVPTMAVIATSVVDEDWATPVVPQRSAEFGSHKIHKWPSSGRMWQS